LGTEPIPDRDLPAGKAYAWDAEADSKRSGQLDAVLRIHVLSTGRQIQLPSGEDVEIGRLDAAHGIFPDVDLTPDGGLEGGVSRRHCKIYQDEGEYFVEDLGSANGTFLSGERLTPYMPHKLEDGDALQLGRVALEIAIQR
jgi:pSer/pThr/pTyr-binding forkhead associated (FHA) protein